MDRCNCGSCFEYFFSGGPDLPDGMKNKYKQIKRIGEGGFSVVLKCHDRETGGIVAIKKIFLERYFDGIPSAIIREVSLLKELAHENIVMLLDVHVPTGGDCIALVFECLDCNLREFIQQYPSVARNPRIVKSFLRQILHGLAYCHAQKILHRDLKPQNLLVDCRRCILKIADFGLARPVGVPCDLYSTQLSTLQYMAPEFILGSGEYSTPADIWSVGCIFAEMVTQRYLFHRSNCETDQAKNIFSILGMPMEDSFPGLAWFYRRTGLAPEKTSKDIAMHVPGLEPAGADLLSRMLCLDPRKRITADDALDHEYFKDFQDES